MVGILAPASEASLGSYVTAFRERLRELRPKVRVYTAYVGAEGQELKEHAIKLLAQKPVVVLAPSTAAVNAIRSHDKELPVVFVTAFDPIGLGLTDSISRPSRNSTGIQGSLDALPLKQLELARELIPDLRTIGVLYTLGNPSVLAQKEAFVKAALQHSLALEWIALEDMLAGRVPRPLDPPIKVLVLPTDALLFAKRNEIGSLAQKLQVAIIGPRAEFTQAGGLASYGINLRANYARAAEMVARILAGAPVSDIPIELPQTLEVTVNLGVAAAIGIHIPESVLLTADQVVQ